MFIFLQITVGIFCAIGIGCILADVYKLPSIKASKAANSVGKRGDKKVSAIEIYLRGFSGWLAGKIRLNEYKKAQLETDLKTAGVETTPEAYVADALTKAIAVGIFAIPMFFILKIIAFVILAFAVVIYFKEYKAVGKKIKERRTKIEYELPRLASAIEKVIKHNHDVVYILESYRNSAGAELKQELDITVADMRSGGNPEVALSRLETRVGSTMMSDVTRGLIAVEKGDDTQVYWASLAMKFADYQRQLLKQQANSVPRKVRKLSMALLLCFMLIYVAVIAQVLLTSLGTLF